MPERKGRFMTRLWRVVAIFLLLIALLVGQSILTSRRQHEEQAVVETYSVARVLDSDLGNLVDKVKLALHTVATERERALARPRADDSADRAFIANVARQPARCPGDPGGGRRRPGGLPGRVAGHAGAGRRGPAVLRPPSRRVPLGHRDLTAAPRRAGGTHRGRHRPSRRVRGRAVRGRRHRAGRGRAARHDARRGRRRQPGRGEPSRGGSRDHRPPPAGGGRRGPRLLPRKSCGTSWRRARSPGPSTRRLPWTAWSA